MGDCVCGNELFTHVSLYYIENVPSKGIGDTENWPLFKTNCVLDGINNEESEQKHREREKEEHGNHSKNMEIYSTTSPKIFINFTFWDGTQKVSVQGKRATQTHLGWSFTLVFILGWHTDLVCEQSLAELPLSYGGYGGYSQPNWWEWQWVAEIES